MTTVRVEAPARLHMGMLDASGDGPRRFGGLGVAVSRPAVVVEASASDELTAEGPDAERALAVAQRCREALGLATGARVRVLEAIPAHAGLGSGTKLALAVTAALSALAGQSPDPAAMARTAGRGARSAVGLWTFALGGFVVEGGRRPGVDRPAPLLTRHAMPDEWRCVLAIPAAEPGISGAPEEAAFADLHPDPDRSAEIAHIVLTALLPALVERDLAEFGAALTRLQRLVGDAFAPIQGGTFHPQSGALVDGAAAARGGGRRPELLGPRRLRDRRQRAAGAGDRARARGRARRRRAGRGRALRQPRRAGGGHVKLLVSVVDAAEARLAVAGGVDVVDAKNPAEGSLGAPAPGVIAQVRDAVPAERPLSVAIGDLPCLPGTAALAAVGAARSGAAYVKLGLWGGAGTEDYAAVLRAAQAAVDGEAAVIAVAYADAARVPSGPLAPSQLVTVARDAGVSGCLIDTAIKDGRGLLSWLGADALADAGRRGARRRARDRAGRRAARGGPSHRPRHRRRHRRRALRRLPRRAAHRADRPAAHRGAAGGLRRRTGGRR